MKKLLIALALVASLAVAQEVKKDDAKKPGHKQHDMKHDGMDKDKKAAMPHHKHTSGANVQWGPGPAVLPPGAQAAVLAGDPSQPGEFTLRLKLPAGYRIPPHWHPARENVTVISGETYLGMGDKWDESKGQKLVAGDYVYMEPGTRHFAWTTSETVLQVHATGPWKLNYVNPADAPAAKK